MAMLITQLTNDATNNSSYMVCIMYKSCEKSGNSINLTIGMRNDSCVSNYLFVNGANISFHSNGNNTYHSIRVCRQEM